MRKHVLVVVSSFPVYSETFVVDHVKGMLESGWEVSVVAENIDRKLFDAFFAGEASRPELLTYFSPSRLLGEGVVTLAGKAFEGIECHPVPGSLNARAMAVKAQCLSGVIRDVCPDLIHAHFGSNGVLAAIALKGLNLPLVVNFHGYDVTSYTKKNGWGLYQCHLNRAVLVGHSEFVRRRLRENMGSKVESIVMGVDTGRFVPNVEKGQQWPRPLRFMSVGRLTRCKGHDVAIEALRILHSRHPEWDSRLSIVGSGEEYEALVEQAQAAGLSDRVCYLGGLDYHAMPAVMQEADVLMVCSQSTEDGWEEAFCRVAVEGMASGLAVVATPCGGLPETINGAGYTARGFEAQSVVDAVEDLLSTETPESLSLRSRRVAARYDLRKMVHGYSSLSNRMRMNS
ncbi:glycosyltransferase family 4 protein [Marinobacter sp. F3R08]|uniref:glycosyltransferase family 4 protein n=1 Tax=Marinobacter sp. F3R08 TaxID=2841559 RepID=UPI001C0884AF|nr:glycosyltransferase family 4 protein [Marinobacter sp. F3R08]MBU2954479.1 glycosyltransferase family 4 protein [Marinobacter sp. F3R08]